MNFQHCIKKISLCICLLTAAAAYGSALPAGVELPEAADAQAKMCVQHDGFSNRVWCFASTADKQSYSYDLDKKQFKPLEVKVEGGIKRVVSFGQSDIAIITESGSLYCYHTITSTLRLLELPQSGSELESMLGNASDTSLGKAIAAKYRQGRKGFGIVNYCVLAFYLVCMLLIGFYFSKNEKSADDFFLAGRRIPWWAAGLSIFGTQLSAITFMAMPAKTYSSNWQYFLQNMGIWMLATPMAVWVFVPFFRRLNVSTAYEYLERRFDVKVRLMASFIYVLSQLLKMGIVIFLPALALTTITGINIQLCIILIGVLCTIYTVFGGIEAVIWTDVVQVVVLLGGAILCGIIIIFDLGDNLPALAGAAWDDAKFSLGSRELDFTRPTLIVILLSMIAAPMPYISDQTVIQRYLTTKDEKATRKSLWTNAIMTIPASLIFFGLGTLFYMFYKNNPALLEPGMDNDAVLPWFTLNHLPAGVSGLLVAGIFAAAMSSLDSAMNSSASAVINDFMIRFNRQMTETKRLFYARFFTVFFGMFGTTAALVMSVYDIKSLWDLCSRLAGLVTGGLCAFFILAAFTKRANTTGAITGAIVSAVCIFLIQNHTSMHFFLYGVVSIAIACIVGYTVSLFTPKSKNNIDGMTIYTINHNREQ